MGRVGSSPTRGTIKMKTDDQIEIERLKKLLEKKEEELVRSRAWLLHNNTISKDETNQLKLIESYLTTDSCGSIAHRVLVELTHLRQDKQ